MTKYILLLLLSTFSLYGDVVVSDNKHNAFTDITEFNGNLYIIFRSATKHVYDKGSMVRVFKSSDKGKNWKHFTDINGHISNEDLRDAFFLDDPTNKSTLVLYLRVTNEEDKQSFSRRYVLNKNGQYSKSKLQGITGWPWRVRYNEFDKKYYTLAYDNTSILRLYESVDGINFKNETVLDLKDKTCLAATEADFAFKKRKIHALIRCNRESSLIGEASIENLQQGGWSFISVGKKLHSPRLVKSKGSIYTAFRDIGNRTYTILGFSELENLKKQKRYDEIYKKVSTRYNWDIGYPGLIVLDGNFYISYYIANYDSDSGVFTDSSIVFEKVTKEKTILNYPI